MSDAKLVGVEYLPLDAIEVAARIRPVSEAALESLIGSIKETGHMLAEIQVRRLKGGGYRLMAGGHRLEAARRLGWVTIASKIYDCGARWARLVELDDNLAHAELDVLEMATFLAERKKVYLEMHPEKRQGIAGGKARQNSATDIVSVAKTIAEKRGFSERHVYRLMSAGEALTADQKRWLRDAPNKVTLADLTALAKEGDERARTDAILEFTRGNSKSVKKALSARTSGPIKSPVEKASEGLINAFRRAPKEARRRFVKTYIEELQELIDDDFAEAAAEYRREGSAA